eukprot:5423526-Ditylum_brightwellii.AAC.1
MEQSLLMMMVTAAVVSIPVHVNDPLALHYILAPQTLMHCGAFGHKAQCLILEINVEHFIFS